MNPKTDKVIIDVPLGDRAKLMSEKWRIRETVTCVPNVFCMQLFDPAVKQEWQVGEGVSQYNHIEHRGHDSCNEFNKDSPTVCFLEGVDPQGRTVTLKVTSVPFSIYVQCPDHWNQRNM